MTYVGKCDENSSLLKFVLPNTPIGKFERIIAIDPLDETEEDVTK